MHYRTTDEALRDRIKAAAQSKGLDTQKATSRYTAERIVDHFNDAMGGAPVLLVGGLQFPQDVRPTADADLRSVVRYGDDELLRGCMRLREILRPEGVDVIDVRLRELRVGLSEPVKRLQVQAMVGGMRGNTQIDVASGFWGKDAWAAEWTADVEHAPTCAALLQGNTTAEGAQATFIVAAMEGGHPFEVHDEGTELEERLVAAATENGLLEMLLELDEDQMSTGRGANQGAGRG